MAGTELPEVTTIDCVLKPIDDIFNVPFLPGRLIVNFPFAPVAIPIDEFLRFTEAPTTGMLLA